MVLETWHLIFILVVFVGVIVVTLHVVLKAKNKKIQRLAQELNFELVDVENISSEHVNLSTYLRYFWNYEFLIVAKINGIQIYFTEYLEKRPSRRPYTYALVSLFPHPFSFTSNEQRLTLQKQIDFVFPGSLLTENGIFYYHSIPWTLKKSTLEPLIQNMVQAVETLQK